MKVEISKHIPIRNTGIQQNDLADGCMLLDQGKAIAYALNVSASFMWSHCDGRHTIEEIVAKIAETSSLPAEVIAEDVTQTITDLHQHGLLYLSKP